MTTTTSAGTSNTNNTNNTNNPASSSSITARPADTINVITSNTVGGDQYNNTYQTIYYSKTPQNTTAGPNSSSEISPSVSFNDAPLGLLSAHFSGRQDELAHMMKAFEAVRGDVPTRFGIYAGPGVGKSQLSLALAKESFAKGRYKCVLWIPATTIEKLHQGFSKLLHLVGHSDRFAQEEIVRLLAARRWLEIFTSGRWLLVLDNVVPETVEFLREYLPRTNNHGNILFTTRTKKVATALAQTSDEEHEILELSIPDEGDAALLLLGHFRHGEIDVDESKAQEIAKCVGRLPLAIAQAAAYVKETGGTLDALLTVYNSEQKIDMMKWENDLSIYQETSVAATFTCQLDDLQQHFPNVSNLLKIIAYFDPESIQLDMLIRGASVLSKPQPPKTSDSIVPAPQKTISFVGKVKNKILRQSKGKGKDRADETSSMSAEMSSLLALIQSPMGLPNAIAQLQNRSLTKQKGTGKSSSLWMHDITQLIVLDNTKKGGDEREWYENAVDLACAAFEQVDKPESPQSWGQYEVLIPHIQSLTIRQGISGSANSSLLRANSGIAEYLLHRGRYRDAEVLCKQVISSQEKLLGPEHVDTLNTKHNLAAAYESQGRYNDGEMLYKQVLSSREKLLGPEHVETLTTKNNLAGVYDSQGRYSDAEALIKQIVSSLEKQLGPEHVYTLSAKNNLAAIYESQGRYSDAEMLHKQILSSLEKLREPEHVSTLTTKSNLALVYYYQGRYSDAEALFKQVCSSQEELLGSEHVSMLITKNNLAAVYKSQGRYNDAEALCNQVLLNQKKILGPEHVTLITKSNLSGVYKSQGRYRDAEALYKEVFSSRVKVLGPEHVDTLITKSNLAVVYKSQGRYSDAEALCNEVLLSQERQLGPEHVNTLTTKNDLAGVYESQGRYSDAEVLYKQVFSSREKVLGPEHVHTLDTKYCLAHVHTSQDRYTEAEALLEHVLAGYEKWLGSSHPYMQKAQRLLAKVYTEQGRVDDAEKTIQSVSPSPP